MDILVSSGFMSRLRGGKSWSPKIFLYPRKRMGLIQVKNTLLKNPFTSSGEWVPFASIVEGFFHNSRSKSAAWKIHRISTGFDISVHDFIPDGTVQSSKSNDMAEIRYRVVRSKHGIDRYCCKNMSRLRPNAAISEVPIDVLKTMSFWGSLIR